MVCVYGVCVCMVCVWCVCVCVCHLAYLLQYVLLSLVLGDGAVIGSAHAELQSLEQISHAVLCL